MHGFGRLRTAIASAAGAGFILAAGAIGAQADPYDVRHPEYRGEPGTVIHYDGIPKIQLTSAMVYRFLYRSKGLSDETIPVSGIIVAPNRTAPPGGWPVIAWAHPTTGVAEKCAPSLLPNPIADIPGINDMIRGGYVVVATDYPGLGTPGPHPFMVGVSEGRAVLDAVRAARGIREVGASDRYVLWGHSQGGHAALWASQLGPIYAPEVRLLGIAVAAPATHLGQLFEDDLATLAGKVLTGYVISAWSAVFGYPMDALVLPDAMADVQKIAAECITLPVWEFEEMRAGDALPDPFLKDNPRDVQPWADTITDNVPGHPPDGTPVFVAQGTGDTIVHPSVTDEYVKDSLCANGLSVLYMKFKGVDHTHIAEDAAPKVMRWIGDRFAGRPVPNNCQ